MDGQGTTWRRNIAENFNRLSRAHQRYRRQTTDRQTDRQTDDRRQTTDGPSMTNSEHELEFTFAKNGRQHEGIRSLRAVEATHHASRKYIVSHSQPMSRDLRDMLYISAENVHRQHWRYSHDVTAVLVHVHCLNRECE